MGATPNRGVIITLNTVPSVDSFPKPTRRSIYLSGTKAPILEGETTSGRFSLSNHSGKQVVVYFYPKDMTPGCTTDARDFRDAIADFEAANTIIVGVSKDSVARHEKFQDKECLPFPLISDESGELCEAWGFGREKELRKDLHRSFAALFIDSTGSIVEAWNKVVKGHVEAVLAVHKSTTKPV